MNIARGGYAIRTSSPSCTTYQAKLMPPHMPAKSSIFTRIWQQLPQDDAKAYCVGALFTDMAHTRQKTRLQDA